MGSLCHRVGGGYGVTSTGTFSASSSNLLTTLSTWDMRIDQNVGF